MSRNPRGRGYKDPFRVHRIEIDREASLKLVVNSPTLNGNIPD